MLPDASMTPLGWVLGLFLPACAAAGANGLPIPLLLDVAHIVRPASPNTALAAPAGFVPRPDLVTAVYPVSAERLAAAISAVATAQPRTFLAANYPQALQRHWVVRSAVLNFPDLVTAQAMRTQPRGPGRQRASAVFAQRGRLWGFRGEPPAPDRLARCPGYRGQTLSRKPVTSMNSIGSFLHDVWRLSRPYFRSEEKWSAWTLLISIIALNLAMVGMNVVLNFWNRLFFNALQAKDWAAFWELLLTWRRTPSGFIMPGFCEVAAVYILVAVYATYLNQWLQIRWRRWMTTRFLDEWLADRAYYRISLTTDPAAIGTDNPDQRIAEDLRDFVATTLSLGVDFLSNVVLVQLPRHPVGLVGVYYPVRRYHPRLHGVRGAGVCGGRHLANPSGGPPVDRAALPPATGGGGLPVCAGALPGEHGRHRSL